MNDKELELRRYDNRAHMAGGKARRAGALSVAPFLRAPYTFYETCIKQRVRAQTRVLEIGAGTGEFTGAALDAGAAVTATDISEKSLEALAVRFGGRFGSIEHPQGRHGGVTVRRGVV